MRDGIWHSVPFAEEYMTPLLELRGSQYAHSEFAQREYVHWQLKENPAGRAISWIALQNPAKVIGEYWMVPARFRINRHTYLGTIGANALVDSEHRRQNVFIVLGKRCSHTCLEQSIEFTLYVPNRLSLRGLIRRLDCADLGEVPFLVYPFDMNKLAEHAFRGAALRKLTPQLMRGLCRLAISPRKDPKIGAEAIELFRVSNFDPDFDLFWDRIRDKYPSIAVRDSGHMNWRYARAPLRKYAILLARGGDRILGYLISRSATIRGLQSGIIMDFLFESSPLGQTAGHTLLETVMKDFAEEKAHLVCCLSLSHTEEYRVLRSHGFVKCPGLFKPHPFHLIAQIHNTNFKEPCFNNINDWYWTLGDYDIF